MKKILMLCGILFCAIAVQAQVKRTVRPVGRFNIAAQSRSLTTKKVAVAHNSGSQLDSTQFLYPSAYATALYFSRYYLAYADFHPSYIIDGTKPDTKIEFDLYSSNGKLLANIISGPDPLPTDPYNNHPTDEFETMVHGGHKIMELMTQPCTLKIKLLTTQEDTVKCSYLALNLKYSQDYVNNYSTNHIDNYGQPAGQFFLLWHQNTKDIVLTKESPIATLHFQYNKNLVSANAPGNNSAFMPIY